VRIVEAYIGEYAAGKSEVASSKPILFMDRMTGPLKPKSLNIVNPFSPLRLSLFSSMPN
jgi:hypothetical protein